MAEERRVLEAQTQRQLLADMEQAPKQSAFVRARRWALKNPTGAAGLAMLVLLAAAGIFADVLATHGVLDYTSAGNLDPSAEHYLGTDSLGRDIYSLLMQGARISLSIGVAAVLLGVTGGAVLGLVSAYIGGWFDLLLQRLIDAKIAIPGIILSMVILAVLGANVVNLIIAIAIGFIAGSSRIIRSVVLREKETVYALAARSLGASHVRIMFRHLLPNSLAPYFILISVQVGSAIISEASLSFLGLGPGPETPSWGQMLSVAARNYFDSTPALAIAPGLAITIAVLGFNLFGDAMRDTLDPRLKGGGR
ncbi:MAG: ABC transporter permease [Dehalococcoidia bacterium]